MKAQARAKKAPARERYGGARIVAALLSAAAGVGAVAVHFAAFPPEKGLRIWEIHAGAAGVALYVGWSVLGVGLGKGAAWAVIRGVTAAGVALAVFCLAAGTQSAARAMSYIRFGDAAELIYFLLQRALAAAEGVLGSPAVAAAAAGGVAVSLAAEGMHALWRWRGAEAGRDGEAVASPVRGAGPVVRRR